jgi:hypothetical protein
MKDVNIRGCKLTKLIVDLLSAGHLRANLRRGRSGQGFAHDPEELRRPLGPAENSDKCRGEKKNREPVLQSVSDFARKWEAFTQNTDSFARNGQKLFYRKLAKIFIITLDRIRPLYFDKNRLGYILGRMTI